MLFVLLLFPAQIFIIVCTTIFIITLLLLIEVLLVNVHSISCVHVNVFYFMLLMECCNHVHCKRVDALVCEVKFLLLSSLLLLLLLLLPIRGPIRF